MRCVFCSYVKGLTFSMDGRSKGYLFYNKMMYWVWIRALFLETPGSYWSRKVSFWFTGFTFMIEILIVLKLKQ